MIKYNQDEYLERQFKKSILTLAADPLEQVISEIPGCITCDMAEEFDSYRTLYFVEQWSRFTTEQVDIINQIDHILSEHSGEAFKCLFLRSVDEIDMSVISEVLESEEWVTIRELARRFIRSMKWEWENLGDMYIREITFGRKLTTSIFKEGTGITTEFNHTFDLSSWLNSMIYKPIDYEEPIKVFNKSLEGKY